MHRRLWEVIPYVPLGQLKQPFLWRKNISGVLKANTLVFWNIEKIERRQRNHESAELRDHAKAAEMMTRRAP